MKLSGCAQMREIDRHVISDLGVPGARLMAAAAQETAAAAMEFLPVQNGRAAVFCGVGNNGGDGIGAAALLLEKGVFTRVFLVGDAEKLTPDSKKMLDILIERGGLLEPFDTAAGIEEFLNECGVVIDALFGIGLNSELRGNFLTAVEMINSSPARKISADIPSGVCADTGRILGAAVKADLTVTFSLAKAGHFVEPGCTCCGELRVRNIGIPREIIDDAPPFAHAVMPEDISLPRRRPDTHKGDYGRVLIVAGSVGYTGAPALCARAASRTGAGLVYLGVPAGIYTAMAVKLTEEMPFPLAQEKSGRFAKQDVEKLLELARQCDACLIGPGLGQSPEAVQLVLSVLRTSKTPVILDADGINAITGNINILDNAACPLILTPHPGEFARLGGDLSNGDRLSAARNFAQKHGCILALKGHRTITATPDGAAYINTTGGPAMAKGGSGDVLAGMIAALVAQKFPIKDAVLAAVYLHGAAGDMCALELGEYSVTASDIIDMLPKVMKKVII